MCLIKAKYFFSEGQRGTCDAFVNLNPPSQSLEGVLAEVRFACVFVHGVNVCKRLHLYYVSNKKSTIPKYFLHFKIIEVP